MVKANAYGHGAVAVACALAPEADAFGVACIEEALALRAAGISVFGPNAAAAQLDSVGARHGGRLANRCP